MIIKSVKLVNFRSHEMFLFEFHKQTTMIAGENGCGKTSILEAIYEGCQGKSFRAVDKEIVQRGKDIYKVEINYVNGEKTSVEYDLVRNKKRFLVSDKEAGRLPKKNKYPIVLFTPDDLHLLSTSPTNKRAYFDRELSQITEVYSNALAKFNKVLKQRNDLLKEEYLASDALFAWNVMLAKYGTMISKAREKWVSEINSLLQGKYASIAENEDEVKLMLMSEVTDESEYLKKLEENFARDRVVGHTTFGTQKDDFIFYFNGSDADGTASRGEIRSMIIALKFIEAEKIEEKLGKKPIVLLDDVFSELDDKRQKALAKNFKNNQVIITSVNGV